MPIIVHSITTSLEEPAEAALSRAASLLGVRAADACIVKTSLDARKRDDIHFVHTVALTLGTPAEEEAAASRCADSWAEFTRSVLESTQIFFARERAICATTHSSPRPMGLDESATKATTSTSSRALHAETFSSSPRAS